MESTPTEDFLTIPTYTFEPQKGEQRLDSNGHAPVLPYIRPLPKASFRVTETNITLRLYNQEGSITTATFFQDSLVSGEISQGLYKADAVAEILVKLEGRMNIENAETSARKVKLVDDVHSIFKRGSSTATSTFPFSFAFPSKYSDDGSDHPIPPSYILNVPRVSGTNGQIEYFIIITVVKHSLFKQSKSIKIPIVYAPRSRPAYPIPSAPSQIPSKDTPGWKQVNTTVKTTSNVGTVTCALIIPSVNVYGVEDTIPFFLQISGSRALLQELLPSCGNPSETSSPFISSPSAPSNPRQAVTKAKIVVNITRRYGVTVLNDTATRERVLGYGILETLPPSLDLPDVLLWKGHVRPDERVSVGGFKSGALDVQDLLVVELNPPLNSVLKSHRAQQRIRLVSESYEDQTSGPRRGLEKLHAAQGPTGARKFGKELLAASLTYIG